MLANRGSISISNLSEKERKTYSFNLDNSEFSESAWIYNLVKNVSCFQKYLGSSMHVRITLEC